MKGFGPVAFATFAIVALTMLTLRAAGRGNSGAPSPRAGNLPADKTRATKPVYSKSGYDITPLSEKRVEELAKDLTPEERNILLAKGTERAFCGVLLDNKKEGIYICRLCGLPLFSSKAKLHSGTGWPSFFQPVDPAHIRQVRDTSHGMIRTETLCVRCRSHLGRAFDDGPPPTGLRCCMDSIV